MTLLALQHTLLFSKRNDWYEKQRQAWLLGAQCVVGLALTNGARKHTGLDINLFGLNSKNKNHQMVPEKG